MAYIGNTVQNQGFSPAVDYFNGDGVTVTFTLSRPVASVAQLTAVIENVIQNPSTAFTVAGNEITFTSAPPAGTNNVWVEYTSLVTTYAAISQDPTVIGDITATGGYLSTGDFGNSYVDGTIVDYVTGNARITTGPIDDMTFYHGGTASRSEMMRLSYAGNSYIVGNLGVGITTPNASLHVQGTPSTDGSMAFNQQITSTTAYNASPQSGALVSLKYTSGGGYAGMGGWSIVKENATDGNYASAMLFHTRPNGGATTERMRINSNGIITTPYQPALVAVVTSNKAVSASTSLAFDSITLNRGNSISASLSNSRFTVSVAGCYKVDLFWFLASSGNDSALDIVVNGSSVYRLGTNIGGVSGTASYLGSGGGVILNLAANDYVEIFGSGSKTILGSSPVHSAMSISLLG